MSLYLEFPQGNITMTKRSACDFDSNFTRIWWGHYHLLYHQRLSCFPSNRSCQTTQKFISFWEEIKLEISHLKLIFLVRIQNHELIISLKRRLTTLPLHLMGFPAVVLAPFPSIINGKNWFLSLTRTDKSCGFGFYSEVV